MPKKPYGIFCPTSKACEVLEPRWTIQILGEMWEGHSRFNEIRRGIPNISPSLLSRRLKEMQENGLVDRIKDPATGAIDYFRTEMAIDLEPIQHAMAKWAQRHIDAEIATGDRNADTLMWTLRKRIDVDELPKKRNVIRFHFDDADSIYDTYWLISKPGEPVEVCVQAPALDVDLFVETTVEVMTGLYLGRRRLSQEKDRETIFFSGDQRMARNFDRWVKFSQYAYMEDVSRFY